jgi:phosphatidylglycerol lysyltransferase
MSRWGKRLGGVFSAVVFAAALFVLHRVIGRFDAEQVMGAVAGYPAGTLVGALAMCVASYACLSGFDWLALHHIRRPLPGAWTALVSFVSHAVSHNAGFAVLTGGSVRLRMYSTFGLSIGEVAGVIAFAGLTFALGTVVLAGGAFILESVTVARLLHLPAVVVEVIGWVAAALLAGYLGWTGLAGRPISVGPWRFATPPLGLSLAQIMVAATDLALVAAALYLLLPIGDELSYSAFIGLYVVATIAGIASHVPGGLGVFEGALILMLPAAAPNEVLGALLVFRVFYNLLPLVLAAVVLAVFELLQRSHRLARPLPWLESLGPAVCSALVFGAGVVMLVGGAVTPRSTLPLWLAEPAHLFAAAAGAVLLVAAWGLVRQNRRAWWTAMAVLAVGVWLALLRGPDWLGAGFLAGALAVLVTAAPLFHRDEAAAPLPWGWLGAAAAVVLVAFWLTAHRGHAGLPDIDLLWHFAPAESGARALRGNVMAVAALAAAWVGLRFPAAAAGPAPAARRP